jgi:Fe-S oxidoreductase
MSLQAYQDNMERCIRCSACKWTVYPHVRSARYASGCPSIDFGGFHAYSGGGKAITALALLQGRIAHLSDETLRTINACTLCGGCDVSCKHVMGDMVEPMEILRELRAHLVERGEIDPAHQMIVEGMKAEDNVFGLPKAERAAWARDLNIRDAMREPVDVLLHVGCQLSYDRQLWPVVRGVASLLERGGVRFGTAGSEEECCAGRAFNCGFRAELDNYAQSMQARVRRSGAKTLLTACADCYGSFTHIYRRHGHNFDDVEIVHFTEFLERLLRDERLGAPGRQSLRVTYHDPCNLGRMGERYERWDGERELVMNKLVIKKPAKQVCFGTRGVYDSPRAVLRALPGVELVEMERVREYAYCCGAGAGAKEAHPEFALFAARRRLEEARSTGADALVTACPWALRNFKDALEADGGDFAVFDVAEIVARSFGAMTQA